MVVLSEFLKISCTVNYDEDSHIKQVFQPIFTAIASKARHYTHLIKGKQSSYENWPIYTTNYDRVQDIFWEGTAELNDLFKEENKVYVMQTHRLDEPSLKLVKLHGSHEWYKLDDATIVKSESSRIRLFFRRFKIDLLETQNWIVIGYSFNDLFIREIFLEYIDRPSHKLIIVDPKATSIVRDNFGINRTNVEAIDNKLEDSEAVSKVKNAILDEAP